MTAAPEGTSCTFGVFMRSDTMSQVRGLRQTSSPSPTQPPALLSPLLPRSDGHACQSQARALSVVQLDYSLLDCGTATKAADREVAGFLFPSFSFLSPINPPPNPAVEREPPAIRPPPAPLTFALERMVSRILGVADFTTVTDQFRPQIATAFAPRNQIERPRGSARKRDRMLLAFVGTESTHSIIAFLLERAFRVRRYLSFMQLCLHSLFSVVTSYRSAL